MRTGSLLLTGLMLGSATSGTAQARCDFGAIERETRSAVTRFAEDPRVPGVAVAVEIKVVMRGTSLPASQVWNAMLQCRQMHVSGSAASRRS